MLENVLRKLTDEDEHRADGGTAAQGGAGQQRVDTADSTASDPSPAEDSESVASDEGPTVGLDQIFGVLKNRRRRDVLRYLAEESDQVRLGTLAELIAARECDKEVARITSQERKRVYVGLYQCHLPKLADVGAIDYNKPRGTIERGPNFERFSHYLPEDEDATEPTGAGRNLLQSVASLLP